MKENPEKDPQARQRSSTWKLLIVAAATLAVVQACLTIEGTGIEGFVLWVIILFAGYLLLFCVAAWLWQRYKAR
jgi:hypothetical protein